MPSLLNIDDVITMLGWQFDKYKYNVVWAAVCMFSGVVVSSSFVITSCTALLDKHIRTPDTHKSIETQS